MPAPENRFKSALMRGERLIGCWAGFADPYATEVLASAGFDWLVIDGEHAPNDLRSISAQLAMLAGRHSLPVVRRPGYPAPAEGVPRAATPAKRRPGPICNTRP